MSCREEIKVSCYEGYRAQETPRCFMWRNQPFLIEEIQQVELTENISRSREYVYDVKTSKGEKFEISFNAQNQKWYITLDL